ncbi:MAG: restriction endonuclease subunit S [Ignavibacteriaceae bacterium]|nr:restriction endonuclease subunit S [Ignavibacteriaceae bacterium]
MNSIEQIYRLGELCDFEKGKTGIASAIPGDYPLITTGQYQKTASNFDFDSEAVCVPLVSSTGHGKKSLNYIHYINGKFALGTILVAVTSKDKDVLLPEYLHIYLLRNKDNLIVPLMRGAANVSLSIKDLANIEIKLPEISEQKRIIKQSKTVDGFKKKITIETELQGNLLAQLRQSILQEAIEGKLTAEWRKNNPVIKGDPDYDAAALLEKIKEEKERLIKEGKIKREKPLPPIKPEEIPFPLPEGWVWTRLGEVALTINRGISPLYSGKSYKKILNQKCVRLGYLDQSFAKTVEDHWEQSIDVSFRIANFDLLVNSTGDGTIGRCAIASINEEGLLFDSHILRVRFFTNHISSLYVQIINSGFVQDQIKKKKRATTTKQTELGVNNLSSFLFPLLGLKEISQLDFKLNQMFSVLVNSQKELQKQIDAIKLLKT